MAMVAQHFSAKSRVHLLSKTQAQSTMTIIPYSLNGEIIQLVPLEEYEKLQHELTTAQASAIYWQQQYQQLLSSISKP